MGEHAHDGTLLIVILCGGVEADGEQIAPEGLQLSIQIGQPADAAVVVHGLRSHDAAGVETLPGVIVADAVAPVVQLRAALHIEAGRPERIGEIHLKVVAALQVRVAQSVETRYKDDGVVAELRDGRQLRVGLELQPQHTAPQRVGEQHLRGEVELVVMRVVVAGVHIGAAQAEAVAQFAGIARELGVGVVVVVARGVVVVGIAGEDIADGKVRLGERGLVAHRETHPAPLPRVGRLTDDGVFLIVLAHAVVQELRAGVAVLPVVHVLMIVEVGAHDIEGEILAVSKLFLKIDVKRWGEITAEPLIAGCAVGPVEIVGHRDVPVGAPEPAEKMRRKPDLEIEAVFQAVEILQA